MAPRDCAPTTAPSTTRRSSPTPTATTSRPFAWREPAPRSVEKSFVQSEERLTHTDAPPFLDLGAQDHTLGREHDDRRAVLEPAHLFALGERRIARNDIWPAIT